MANTTSHPIRRSERGQSVIEFAITFLVLMLILSVVVDVGRMYFASIAIREAAEEGALYGALGNFGGIATRVRQSSTSPIDLSDLSKVNIICPDALGDDCANLTGANCLAAGDSLRVTVQYEFDFLMPLIRPVIGSNSIVLNQTAVTTVLSSGC